MVQEHHEGRAVILLISRRKDANGTLISLGIPGWEGMKQGSFGNLEEIILGVHLLQSQYPIFVLGKQKLCSVPNLSFLTLMKFSFPLWNLFYLVIIICFHVGCY